MNGLFIDPCVLFLLMYSLLFICLQDDGDLIDRDDQQRFLASADFLSTNGLPTLISNMQAAVTEVIKG